jgi:ATP sulfurylase
MRGNLVNWVFKAFNKQSSGLTVKCLEIPHYAYSSRCGALEEIQYIQKKSSKINYFC